MSKILYNGLTVDEAILPEYEVGKTHQINFQLLNDYDVPVEYTIESLNPEVNIIKYPKKLEAKRKDDLLVHFSPDISLREAFQSSFKIKEIFKWLVLFCG